MYVKISTSKAAYQSFIFLDFLLPTFNSEENCSQTHELQKKPIIRRPWSVRTVSVSIATESNMSKCISQVRIILIWNSAGTISTLMSRGIENKFIAASHLHMPWKLELNSCWRKRVFLSVSGIFSSQNWKLCHIVRSQLQFPLQPNYFVPS
jgi:hypothetical protein